MKFAELHSHTLIYLQGFVSTYLEGEVEGVYDVSLGVPVILCKRGVQTIVPVKMADDEKLDFFEAARAVKKCTYKIKDVLEL